MTSLLFFLTILPFSHCIIHFQIREPVPTVIPLLLLIHVLNKTINLIKTATNERKVQITVYKIARCNITYLRLARNVLIQKVAVWGTVGDFIVSNVAVTLWKINK